MNQIANGNPCDAATINAAREFLSLYPEGAVEDEDFHSPAFRQRTTRMDVLERMLSDTKAETMAGIKAKAGVLRLLHGEAADLAASLAFDLA